MYESASGKNGVAFYLIMKYVYDWKYFLQIQVQ